MSLSKVVGSSVLLWAGIELSYFIWKKVISNKDLDSECSNDSINTVLFFDSRSPECFIKDHNSNKCERINCPLRNMRYITKCLENAKTSIDVCMYKLSATSLSSRLEAAIKSGVKVRVLCDRDRQSETRAVISLRQAGAFVRVKEYEQDKQRDHLLMHHKFVVIDEKLLITGSLNWTTSAVSGNWEDAAIISEPSIIHKFQNEFEYLWDNHNTPGDLLPIPVNPPVFPSNMSVWKENPFDEVFMFSDSTAPCRGHMSPLKFERQEKSHAPYCAYTVLRNLGELLGTAEKSIDICLLLLNLENIADIFLDAFFRGIKVRMVADSHCANLTGSQVGGLITEDVPVRGKHYHSNMHHKFIILDKKLVVFGSFNWSMQALCGNAENLVCTNNDAIVKKFSEQFSEMWNEFEPIEIEKIGLRNFS